MANARQDANTFDVVVSGGGPTGLASALEAVYAGKRVAIVSDRDIALPLEKDKAFSRGQPIHLDEGSRYRLLNLFPKDFQKNPNKEDTEFLNLLQTDVTIGTRHIERFLFRRLEEANKNPNKPAVTYFNRKEIQTLDVGRGRAIITDSNNSASEPNYLQFKTLIAADGAKHHAVNKLNLSFEAAGKKQPIEYHPIAGPNHKYHASFALNIKRKDGKPINVKRQFVETSHRSGWKQLLAGISFNTKTDQTTVKCVFGGEIPEYLNKAFDEYAKDGNAEKIKKKIISYAGNILAGELGLRLNEVDITFRESRPQKKEQAKKSSIHEQYQASKDKLNFMRFGNRAERASKAYYEENGNVLLAAGDAYASPNYQYGHGANDGLRHAFFIGEVLRSKTYSYDDYDHACHTLSEKTQGIMRWLNRLNVLFQLGDKLLLRVANQKPGRVLHPFEGITNPEIAGVIRPLNEYLSGFSLTKSSAIALRKTIIESDQKIETVKKILAEEQKRVSKKWFSFGKYKEMLEETRLAATRRIPENQVKKSVAAKSNGTWESIRRASTSEKRPDCSDKRRNTLPWPGDKQQSVTRGVGTFDHPVVRANTGSRQENEIDANRLKKPRQ
ncbi:MAG TPA: hypothetical protein VLJ15_05120 [Gammaproteobacteria bacterium]|nr:hypothetical protein [Gammaproteobacteria bacterium]